MQAQAQAGAKCKCGATDWSLCERETQAIAKHISALENQLELARTEYTKRNREHVPTYRYHVLVNRTAGLNASTADRAAEALRAAGMSIQVIYGPTQRDACEIREILS